MHAVVDTHKRCTELSVVYTNNPFWVEHSIHIMELLLGVHVCSFRVLSQGRRRLDVDAQSHPRRPLLPSHKALPTSRQGIACQNLVDIQGQHNIWGSKKHEKESLVHLAEAIIDPYYRYMKVSCNKDKRAWHSAWMEKLVKAHVVYAAKEAYTSYEIYMRIIDMKNFFLPQNGQGSSQKHSNGKCGHNKK
ncbi:hypothetical protein D1007_23027 [Hordeum vulgare]|nr:hypothetical protein D1007_23027 [Hordeum vulgare]